CAKPIQITRGIERTTKAFVAELKLMLTDVKDNELTDVAAVSAANNPKVGNMIAEAMSKVGRQGSSLRKEMKMHVLREGLKHLIDYLKDDLQIVRRIPSLFAEKSKLFMSISPLFSLYGLYFNQISQSNLSIVEVWVYQDGTKNFVLFVVGGINGNRFDEEIIEANRHIRAFNAIKVAVEYRKKIQVFYGLLLQYFSISANKKPLNFRLLNLLVKPLTEMSIEIPYSFPSRCYGPAILLMSEYLTSCLVTSGLRMWQLAPFCAQLFILVYSQSLSNLLQYGIECPLFLVKVRNVCQQSKKFCLEALVFLRTLLMAASNKKPEPSQNFKWLIFGSFVSTRDYEPDCQRAEDRKLKKVMKREAKGAARELMKDNYFLAEAKARDKARLDA
ncbi:nucleolar protein 14, partial [Tanacetum coccineum]